MYKVSRDTEFLGQAPYAPMHRVLWSTVECGFQHFLNPIISVTARLAAALRIRQTRQLRLGKAAAPLGDRLLTRPVSLRDLFTRVTAGTIQHNAGAKMQTGGGITPATPAFECRFFLFAQFNDSG
jgi:hypothetical protein